ncbi:type II toxin-antitoxin system VapC family toxin [Microbacterium elymi]|uniref:Ribonuclease VapC n=1 Tax=Microbacterium elymi TaxID=2909587 RepID=A0ABY5NKG2_9MICO|nr:type II toxin-antitoxin system VapC family toxin [Microbacterium elymi]UUT35609.1 type II toxin-antitoxin system VapC family toxin [Microbacterium elymi]
MIVYFDTSAFLPLVVQESGSTAASRLWGDADQVVSTRLILVEAAAAVGQAHRLGRLTEHEHDAVQEDVWRLATELTLIEVFSDLVDRAARLAVTHALRGYDAVHLASATLIQAREVLFASGDQRLLRAAHDAGFITADTGGTGW